MSYSTPQIYFLNNIVYIIQSQTVGTAWGGGGSSPSISCTDDGLDLEGLNLLCLKSTSLTIEICHAKELEMWYVPAGVSCTDGVNTSISSSVCVVDGIKAKMI